MNTMHRSSVSFLKLLYCELMLTSSLLFVVWPTSSCGTWCQCGGKNLSKTIDRLATQFLQKCLGLRHDNLRIQIFCSAEPISSYLCAS
uniref:Secreted protein n=1 Tax=Aegilops tauschii subsp. strangulata TaxID=200361 RepID=A0A453M0I3_AEGTS